MSEIGNLRVMVVEPTVTGHRLYYVRLITEEILARGHGAVIVTSPNAPDSAEWDMHLAHLAGQVEVLERPNLSPRSVAKLSDQLKVSRVVVPDGDSFAVSTGFRRSWPAKSKLSVLVMREHAQPSRFPGAAMLKNVAKKCLLRSANATPGVRVCILKSSLWAGNSSITIARDPVTLSGSSQDREAASRAWNLEADRYWFGVFGSVTARKNLPLVASALAGLGTERVGLIVAGSFSEEVRRVIPGVAELLNQVGVTLRIHDRLLDELELDALIEAVDCVVLAHSNEGSSGIMGKAAVSGTRIAAAGARSLRADCRAIPSISEWAHLSVSELTTLLARASTLGRPVPYDGLSSREFVSALL